ncbi:hypothetical protein GCM10008983_06480 [Lentibacillus halophilus]|uniref:Uncharacterized protein n=1 Tax=Lentibacillus halophilus TaxID=295065 RepID=A0ABP3IY17_9BACI
MSKNNKVANGLYLIGVFVMIAGFLGGLILGDTEIEGLYGSYSEFTWSIFIGSTISGILSGAIFIGLSEIIDLLQETVSNSKVENQNDNVS